MLHSCGTVVQLFRNLIIMAITKSSFLTVRLPSKTRTMFVRKATPFGKPSEVLRELIEAFIDGRLTIQKPVTSKDKLYE